MRVAIPSISLSRRPMLRAELLAEYPDGKTNGDFVRHPGERYDAIRGYAGESRPWPASR